MRDGTRIWAKRAGLLAAAGVLLLGNLGFFVWYRGTSRDRKEGLEQRRAALERQVVAKEQEARKVSTDRKRLTDVRLALDKFYGQSVGLRRESLAGFVDELHIVLKRVGVSPAQIGYNTSVVKDPPVTQMAIAFTFKADYGKFKQLLEALQTDRKWMAVRDIGLSRDEEVPGGVQVTLTLVTYFAGEDSDTPRASLAGGPAR